MWNFKHKYNAKRTVSSDGKSFPSKGECALYDQLRFREKIGEIEEISLQHRVRLTEEVFWKVDFMYRVASTGEMVLAEYKGMEDANYKIKKKLFKEFGEMKLEIYKGSYKRLILVETMIPKRYNLKKEK